MAKKGQAVLLVYADVDPRYDEEFNAWYDTEHLPELLTFPGFLDAARYVAVRGGPKYLAAYELESVEALKTPQFTERVRSPWARRMGPSVVGENFARIVGEQIYPDRLEQSERGMAPALQIGRMSVPESLEAGWTAWYNNEYIPAYRTVPGVIYARRFRVVEGEVRFTTMYEFEHERVPDGAEWNYQRDYSSPSSARWRATQRMAPGSPGVYRRITP